MKNHEKKIVAMKKYVLSRVYIFTTQYILLFPKIIISWYEKKV